MLAKRPDLRAEMVKKKMRVGVMAQSESTTDIPEHKDRKRPGRDDIRLTPQEKANYDNPGGIASQTDEEYWDRRARGLGGHPTTCAEENLLGYPGTRYFGENIFVHEFAHGIMGVAIRTADPSLFAEIQAAYKHAMAREALEESLRLDQRQRILGRRNSDLVLVEPAEPLASPRSALRPPTLAGQQPLLQCPGRCNSEFDSPFNLWACHASEPNPLLL
ncbi:MAG: hypothetical protein MOB07_29325 [Acidobacteria bacterium]|nr:hypothetical protein [Acidobacteriota bacterium]